MPQKINMFLSNGKSPMFFQQQFNKASLGISPSLAAPKAPTSLNAPFLARVHNVRPGCGSCGRQ
jgi:hypothetical protein